MYRFRYVCGFDFTFFFPSLNVVCVSCIFIIDVVVVSLVLGSFFSRSFHTPLTKQIDTLQMFSMSLVFFTVIRLPMHVFLNICMIMILKVFSSAYRRENVAVRPVTHFHSGGACACIRQANTDTYGENGFVKTHNEMHSKKCIRNTGFP